MQPRGTSLALRSCPPQDGRLIAPNQTASFSTPLLPSTAPIFFRTTTEPKNATKSDPKCTESESGPPAGQTLKIYASAFFQGGYGVSCSYARLLEGAPLTSGWVLGSDPVSVGPPAYIIEGSLFHALHTLALLRDEVEYNWGGIDCIEIHAGNQQTIERLQNWFQRGTLKLASAATTEISQTLDERRTWLQRPISFEELPSAFFEEEVPQNPTPAGQLLETARRLFTEVLPAGVSKFGERIGRTPWTKGEIKAHLKRKYSEGEHLTLLMLAREGSYACGIHKQLGLNRSVIFDTFKLLLYSRRRQMVLANILCGTFFKFYNKEGERLSVRCPLCPAVCTLDHLCSHVEIPLPATDQKEELAEYLRKLTVLVTPSEKAMPVPICQDASTPPAGTPPVP